MMLRKNLIERWKSYRYRFLPWIALNLKDRKVREVNGFSQDKLIDDQKLLDLLTQLLNGLHDFELQHKCHEISSPSLSSFVTGYRQVMRNTLGFDITRSTSSVPGAGTGVFVSHGCVPEKCLVAFYPGTVYWPHEPILIQSVANPFIFRCIDGLLIDGNDKRISKFIYRSSAGRDFIGPYKSCDTSWLGENLCNPMAVGQYVNNQSKSKPANVAYQELNIPLNSLPVSHLRFIPNVWYGAGNICDDNAFIRTVTLVSVRKISKGEEILSSYFTVVH